MTANCWNHSGSERTSCCPPTLRGMLDRHFGNLAGEWVQVMQLEQRLQVYYCTTLIREIDLGIQRSTIVERWIPS